jgi:hypothetical protein
MPEDIRPHQEDVLFPEDSQEGDGRRTSAELHGWSPLTPTIAAEDICAYSEGYRRAAAIVADHVIENAAEQDFLVFAIMFMYRHYLELVLKDITRHARLLFGLGADLPSGHNLYSLWEPCRGLLKRLKPEVDEEGLAAVESVITEISVLDPTSEAFRYPLKKDGVSPSLPGVRRINIGRVAAGMHKAARFLDGALMMITVYLDYKDDMRDYTGGP